MKENKPLSSKHQSALLKPHTNGTDEVGSDELERLEAGRSVKLKKHTNCCVIDSGAAENDTSAV